jgi:hypothetical protein
MFRRARSSSSGGHLKIWGAARRGTSVSQARDIRFRRRFGQETFFGNGNQK